MHSADAAADAITAALQHVWPNRAPQTRGGHHKPENVVQQCNFFWPVGRVGKNHDFKEKEKIEKIRFFGFKSDFLDLNQIFLI